MNKSRFIYLCAALALCLVSCTPRTPQVEVMKGWSFQYNDGTDDYSLFFGLCDKDGNELSADAEVDIRIETDNNEVVYRDTKAITKDDFSTYTSQAAGTQFLANVRIPASDISPGSSSSGTVYFTVSDSSTFAFDETKCSAYHCLPIQDIQLELPALPLVIQNKSSFFGLQSTVSITDVSYLMDKSMLSPSLHITIAGEKTYENSSFGSGSSIVCYKLLDHEGYVVASGNIYLDHNLSAGDKFKNDTTIYDVTPGEHYTLQLSDYEI